MLGVAVGFLASMAVAAGRCRNTLVADLFGGAAGFAMYVGQFHAGLVAQGGPRYLPRVDLLPAYVSWRMEHAVQRPMPDFSRDGGRPEPALNWVLAGVELALVVWTGASAASGRAARAYCERCGEWKERSLTFLPSKSSRTVLDLLATGRLAELAKLRRVTVGTRAQPYAAMSVEYCLDRVAPPPAPGSGAGAGRAAEDQPCPVFLTVKEVWAGGGAAESMKFDWVIGRLKVPRVELTPAEVWDISASFPGLRGRRVKAANRGRDGLP